MRKSKFSESQIADLEGSRVGHGQSRCGTQAQRQRSDVLPVVIQVRRDERVGHAMWSRRMRG